MVSSVTSSSVSYRERALRSLSDLPPFSPILNKLLASLATEDVPFAKLAELIEKDTVLAGNVLRLVNSAPYGRQGTISSVRHAVSLMGVVKLRNSAMTLSVSSMWNHAQTPKSWSAVRFNLHAVASAIMSDLLAQKVEVDYAEGAFIAGLLHDLGLLLVASSLTEEYDAILRLHEAENLRLPDAERQVLGFDHAELSAAALAEWRLPEPIQKAVRYQWEPPRPTGDAVTLSRLLQVVDQIVNPLGITVMGDQKPAEIPDEVFAQFDLSGQRDEILQEFKTDFESIKSFF